ncbi:SDR family oxidoreductase [Nocardioides sp. KC13]|uniref:SDR family oxidoreductase n=1 Tax=Nocardioides turkmenicus TaxID=2711220 RepID=A0A6M1R6X7_9ACTN|nr:SDR family oxidoreductase [Nocardioides sp. KC13]NGN94421.1 SDR family oxidoreductase [Nocardioides sp. KC13]
MNITVFGATGTIGRHVVEQALAAGHHVTAFTRDAARVTAAHDRLHVVEGDVTDPAACLPAVKGADAVIVTLGAGRKGEVREAGTRAVVAAMKQAGVQRLVCQSTLGVGSSRANLDLFWKYVMFGALLRPAYADHVRQEAVVEESGLAWTTVRPSAFADQSPGPVRHGFDGTESGLRLKIARADVAAFVLAQVEDETYVRRAVSVSA